MKTLVLFLDTCSAYMDTVRAHQRLQVTANAAMKKLRLVDRVLVRIPVPLTDPELCARRERVRRDLYIACRTEGIDVMHATLDTLLAGFPLAERFGAPPERIALVCALVREHKDKVAEHYDNMLQAHTCISEP